MPLSIPEMQAILDQSPYMRLSAMRITRADPAAGILELHSPLRPEYERGYGHRQWHGGPMAALVDTAGDFALVMAHGRPIPTTSLHIDYLRPAIDTGLTAVATVRRQGRTLGVVDIDLLTDTNTLAAIGRATYAMV